MGTQISKSVTFNVGNHIFLIVEEIEKREDRTKYICRISDSAGIPKSDDTALYVWLPGGGYEPNQVVNCTNVKIYLKSTSAALFAEGTTALIGQREEETHPKVDDIHVTDFLPEQITNPAVPSWKIPPAN